MSRWNCFNSAAVYQGDSSNVVVGSSADVPIVVSSGAKRTCFWFGRRGTNIHLHPEAFFRLEGDVYPLRTDLVGLSVLQLLVVVAVAIFRAREASSSSLSENDEEEEEEDDDDIGVAIHSTAEDEDETEDVKAEGNVKDPLLSLL